MKKSLNFKEDLQQPPVILKKRPKSNVFDSKAFSFLQEDRLIESYQKTKSKKKLNEILNKYNGFIYNITKKFRGHESPIISRDDLISEATISFINSLTNFEISKGFRIATYAKRIIEGNLEAYILENKFLYRMPGTYGRRFLIFKLNQIKKYLKLNNYIIHDDDVVKVSKLIGLGRNLTRDVLNFIQQNHISLNEEKDDDNEENFIDTEKELFNNKKIDSLENSIIEQNLHKFKGSIIAFALKKLEKDNPRQKQIIQSRYFDDSIKIKDLSKKYRLSPQRISMIEKQALRNLKKILLEMDIKRVDFF